MLTWMESVNGFFLICFYEWNMWMFSWWFVFMNGICECVLLRLFIKMKFSDDLLAVYLFEWNMWMFFFIVVYTNGIALLLYLNTEPIFWPAFVIIIIFHTFLFQFVFIIYISTYWFISTMVNDDVIVFIIIPIRWFSKYRNVLY